MAIPSSGSLSFADIQTEFGGTNPISLTEYYAGGGRVAAGTSGTYGAVPSSGQISTKNFFGTSAVPPTYVQDVFSTNIFSGGATINNGINLSTYGGMVWTKNRNNPYDHNLWDSARGTDYRLFSNSTAAQQFYSGYGPVFNSNGWTDRVSAGGATENVGWTFRKKSKFFDIVTYTGDGANDRAISHNLGSLPGCVIIKSLNYADDWYVVHVGYPYYLRYTLLNSSASSGTTPGGSAPGAIQFFSPYGDSTFYVHSYSPYTNGWNLNTSGRTYVAYLFANNSGGFGSSGNDNAITCGGYIGSGVAGDPTINLGYQPQWIMIKKANNTGSWYIVDATRGVNKYVLANSANGESTLSPSVVTITSTGFIVATNNTELNEGGYSFIYIAIRAPM